MDNIYGNYLKIMRTIKVVIAIVVEGIFIGIISIVDMEILLKKEN